MLVIKIEMWPKGDESKAKEITRGFIWNDGQTLLFTGGEESRYNYKLMQSAQFDPSKPWKQGEGIHLESRTKKGAWDLLYKVLRHAIAYRNKR